MGLSGHSYYALPQPLYVSGGNFRNVRATGSATASFDDVLVTGPGSGNVSTRLRLHLSGFLDTTSSPSPEIDGVIGSAAISFGISVNGDFVAFGNLDRNSNNGGSPQISASGRFVGFSGNDVVTTDTFLAPLNTPITIQLRLQFSLQSILQDTANGIASATGSFYQSLSFATDGPVFELPVGYSANSPTGGIVNNSYVPTPEPGTAALLLLAAPTTLLRRHRRATPRP